MTRNYVWSRIGDLIWRWKMWTDRQKKGVFVLGNLRNIKYFRYDDWSCKETRVLIGATRASWTENRKPGWIRWSTACGAAVLVAESRIRYCITATICLMEQAVKVLTIMCQFVLYCGHLLRFAWVKKIQLRTHTHTSIRLRQYPTSALTRLKLSDKCVHHQLSNLKTCFLPHSVCDYLRNGMNLVLLIIEMEFVLSEVETSMLYIIYTNSGLQISCWQM
jgi:hypothetical protein